jgi:hypothetical protein|tara:strand:- start:255 stop:563 length:309 start_codon:yes stop_codon:yes gene_type:complete
MKVTKNRLREMIIQELYSDKSVDYVGDAAMKSDFRSTTFDEDTKRITALLDDMETIIREDQLLEKQDLEYFKNNNLVRLQDKISFIEGAISARIDGRIDVSE